MARAKLHGGERKARDAEAVMENRRIERGGSIEWLAGEARGAYYIPWLLISVSRATVVPLLASSSSTATARPKPWW